MSRTLTSIAFSLLLVGCKDPWDVKGAPKRVPDMQFRHGPSEAGADVYVWQCEAGERIAIARSGTFFWPGSARIQRGPCGTRLPFEGRPGEEHREVPDCCRWPGSNPDASADDLDFLDAGSDQ